VPEGDSLRRVAALLQPLVGQRVAAESPHPRGRTTGVAALVDGLVLESVEAVGKHLLLRFEGGRIVRNHLRMNGRWRLGPAGEPRRGLPWLVLRAGELEATQWNGPVLSLSADAVRSLGPDVLADDFDPVTASRRVVGSTRTLGETLLDQRVVAGIGNRWMAEALWEARIAPRTSARDAPLEAVVTALSWVSRSMKVALTGARLRPAVYRRSGRPCPRCGTAIASRGLGDANRTAYWCPTCQPEDVSGRSARSPAPGGVPR
jgi:endonuclease VIII